MTTSPQLLCGAVAAELRGVARLIESLAELLVADEQLALRHLDRLQGFDLAAQSAAQSAEVLEHLARGGCPETAVEAVRLEQVQDRLRSAIAASG